MKSLINRLLLKKSIGNGAGNTFFYRYRLLSTPWFGAYVHRFVRGDTDRCLHDHPWGFLAVVLWGGYFEEMQDGPSYEEYKRFTESNDGIVMDREWFELLKIHTPTKIYWRKPGSVLYRPAKTAHRITLDESKPKPWSLVFVGKKTRGWGFFTVNGWKPWKAGEPNPICETR